MNAQDRADVRPQWSLLVLTRNRVSRCLDSVTHNATALRGMNAEILVVNNGGQPVALPDKMAGIPCRSHNLKRNLGAAARNVALRLCRGDYIWMIDDDAYLDAELACAATAIFERDLRTAAVAFRVFNQEDQEESCLLPCVFHGCACAFRRTALDGIGGYPWGFGYYGEEYDVAFRLIRAGWCLRLCDHAQHVMHARDPGGRDKRRIIRLLVRNNAQLWSAYLPWAVWPGAMTDMLRRYRLVARKECAMTGYRLGTLDLPSAVLRGLLRRRSLGCKLFDEISLARDVRSVAGILARAGLDVVLCGVGKFPSCWLITLQRQGVRVCALLDRNTCWRGQRICSIPIYIPEEAALIAEPNLAWLTGLASAADSRWWMRYLRGQGLHEMVPEKIVPDVEKFAGFTAPVLAHAPGIRLFTAQTDLAGLELRLWHDACLSDDDVET